MYFQAYDWLKDHMTMSEKDYPYLGKSSTCKYDESKGITYVNSYG